MLTREAIEAAFPLAESLDARKLFLAPLPNTPLEALVNATRSDANAAQPVEGGGVNIDVDSILYLADCKDALGDCEHNAVMDNVIEVAAAAVTEHIAFAKTIAGPAVAALAEKVQASLAEMTPSSLLGMEVVVATEPTPLKNGTIMGDVARYSEVSEFTPTLSMKLPSLDYAQIAALLNTGAASTDEDIATWLAAKGEGFLTSLWAGVFTQTQYGLHQEAISFWNFLNDPKDGLDNALAIFLIARRLIDEPIEGIEMQYAAFETLAAEFRNQSAAFLSSYLDRRAMAEKSGILVNKRQGRTTVVNENVYRRWLEAGGENEILFGNLLVGNPSVQADDLLERAEELKRVWNSHAAITATVEANRKFANTKMLFERHFMAQIAEASKTDDTLAGASQGVIECFNEELECLNEGDLADLYNASLKLVCRSRFCHTDAEMILGGIERVKRENPKVDVREAAAISVIEYVAHWVSTQFKVMG